MVRGGGGRKTLRGTLLPTSCNSASLLAFQLQTRKGLQDCLQVAGPTCCFPVGPAEGVSASSPHQNWEKAALPDSQL